MRDGGRHSFFALRVGGSHDAIEIELIANPNQACKSKAARQELKAKLASFDAAKAACFLENDRRCLLAVVEAGFGSFEGFNKTMRGFFDERVRRESSRPGVTEPVTVQRLDSGKSAVKAQEVPWGVFA